MTFEEEMKKIRYEMENGAEEPWVDDTPEFNDLMQRLKTRPIILYGCGAGGYATADWLEEYNVEIEGYADGKRTGIFPKSGTEIISLEKVLSDYNNCNIYITSVNYKDEIKNDLLKGGIPEAQIFMPPEPIPLPPGINLKVNNPDAFLEKHIEGYKWAYNFFEDEESKRVIIGRLRAFMLGSSFPASPNSPEYFDEEIIKLSDDEVFVDGGAFYGTFVMRVNSLCNGKFKHIYAFEPELEKCNIMKNEFSKMTNLTIIQKGLWNKETTLKFCAAKQSSVSSFVFQTSDVTIEVDVTSMDKCLEGKEPPTFIKMDIEGSEYEALEGAKNILKTYKPKLAISAYHKPDDIYKLTRLIHEINPEYKMYLRQPLNIVTETLLYAI